MENLCVVAMLMASLLAPVRPVSIIAVPADELNMLWNTYGDQGGHWTGGDRTMSVPLPDGCAAWLFSQA